MITDISAQSLKAMVADNEELTRAYWSFIKTEYTWYDGHRAKLRTDHYSDGTWDTEKLKKALLSFESNELVNAKAPIVKFEKKYGDGHAFIGKFENDRETQMKVLSSKTTDRLQRIKIESQFKTDNPTPNTHYFKYVEKLDGYKTFRQELANDIYDHALTYEEKIGKYNKDVIVEEMKKLLSFSLWLNPGHQQATAKLSAL
jgi:hypothetical protein